MHAEALLILAKFLRPLVKHVVYLLALKLVSKRVVFRLGQKTAAVERPNRLIRIIFFTIVINSSNNNQLINCSDLFTPVGRDIAVIAPQSQLRHCPQGLTRASRWHSLC